MIWRYDDVPFYLSVVGLGTRIFSQMKRFLLDWKELECSLDPAEGAKDSFIRYVVTELESATLTEEVEKVNSQKAKAPYK